jgi:antitoxin FitA
MIPDEPMPDSLAGQFVHPCVLGAESQRLCRDATDAWWIFSGPQGDPRWVCNSTPNHAPFWSKDGAIVVDLSIKGVPEGQVRRLRERAKANHRSLQGELRALVDEATRVARRRLTVDEVAARVDQLALTGRDEAVRLIREDRDR